MRTLLAVLLALSLFPASAQAQKVQPDYLSVFSTAARQYFGGPTGVLPPCGQPKFEWHSAEEMGSDRSADSVVKTCTIRFVKEIWDASDPGQMGFTIMHEWGHLYVRPGGFGVVDTPVDSTQHSAELPLMSPTFVNWYDVPQLRAIVSWRLICNRHRTECESFPRLRHKLATRLKEK